MDQTLIVTYLPSGEKSRTRRMLNHFLDRWHRPYQLLDLLEKPPGFLTPALNEAFLKRNYLKLPLDNAEIDLLANCYEYIDMLHQSRNLVVVYPMHNFSIPAMVKAFFDAVIIKGETFDIRDGEYVGLMTGRRALALGTCGGTYHRDGPWADFEHCFSLQRCLFQFMGYEGGEVLAVQGCDELAEEEVEVGFEKAFREIDRLSLEWS